MRAIIIGALITCAVSFSGFTFAEEEASSPQSAFQDQPACGESDHACEPNE